MPFMTFFIFYDTYYCNLPKNKKINFLIDKNKKGEYNTRQFKYKNSEEGK